ncbi:MAG: deoxyuridine 5'-triphosphate nucleotidohydrolase [Lachnospiraceae bacterium]|nr:deoxyuridine 5'-triphosphate nucleotidohydrolase [Lachnospiraceae bacterium]
MTSPRIAKFEKVSFEQFKKDWLNVFTYSVDTEIYNIWSDIKLPERATKGSAGYDFYIPFNYNGIISAGTSILIPTGIRCKMNENYVLQIYPRSSYGFKYGLHLANTIGIIDNDYYYSDNEGHIFIKLINDSLLAQDFVLSQGTAFCQGIFTQYGITLDDEAHEVRNGGFGSTNKS